MTSYVYKFEDIYGNILYIGKTNDIERRINQHFSGAGHVKGNCYRDTSRVYYMKFNSDGDALLIEQYMIGKYNPPYNKLGKSKQRVTIEVPIKEKWVLYREFKRARKSCTKHSILGDILYGLVIIGGIFYLLWIL